MNDPFLGVLAPDDLFRHVVIFGSTGSGKTRSVILPLLQQVLASDGNNEELRAGALIFDVKGDMAAHLQAVMRAAERTDKVIIIGRGGNAWFDPFEGRDSRQLTERLMEIVRSIHPQSGRGNNDDFWTENLRRFLQVSIILARADGLGDVGGLPGIVKAVTALISERKRYADDEEDASLITVLDEAQNLGVVSIPDAAIVRQYLTTDARYLADTTWSTICNYGQAYISCLADSRLAKVISPSDGQKFVADDAIDRGRVVLVSLSRVHFGSAAAVYSNLIKIAFQSAALQRFCRSHFDGVTVRLVNATRPVLFVADEFPSLLTVGSSDDGDCFFLDKCRETRIACILSAQGVSALAARMNSNARVNHLLNNC